MDISPREVLKVQLTKPALERLIGGDTQLEIDLRQQVVENFAKKHLKAIANTDVLTRITARAVNEIQELGASIRDMAREQVLAQIGEVKRSWGNSHLKLTPEMAELVKKAIDDEVSRALPYDLVRELVERRVEQVKESVEAQIKERVEEVIDEDFQTTVRAEVARILSAAAAKASE